MTTTKKMKLTYFLDSVFVVRLDCVCVWCFIHFIDAVGIESLKLFSDNYIGEMFVANSVLSAVECVRLLFVHVYSAHF